MDLWPRLLSGEPNTYENSPTIYTYHGQFHE